MNPSTSIGFFRKVLFATLVLLHCMDQSLLGQSPVFQDGHSSSVIPPSPNAMAFQKYGKIPVNYYRGLPNISVPVYEIKSKDIVVPISLSYHASGIKVNEEASKVGLGWVLNATGIISRNIMGEDDFSQASFRYHTNAEPEMPRTSAHDPSVSRNIQDGCVVDVFGTPEDFGNVDTEPDQYYYNLPDGRSGKFILKRDFTVILNHEEKIKIEVIDKQNGNVWEIRTPDGFKYLFTEYESYVSDEQVKGRQKTAWSLTKITSTKGAEMTFNYTSSPNGNYVTPVGDYVELQVLNTRGFYLNNFTESSKCTSDPSSTPNLVPGRQYTSVQLDNITFNEGVVKFYYSDREDVKHDKKIDKVEILVNTPGGTQPQELLKSINFIYEYFEGEQNRINPSSVEESKRLKLKRVDFKSNNDQVIYDYRFDYYNEYDDKGMLPAKSSLARDHWHYYNGKISNQSLIPTHTPKSNGTVIENLVGQMGEERNAVEGQSKLFSLKRIWYPTKGFTDFEYETHTFDMYNSSFRDNSFFRYTPQTVQVSSAVVLSGNTQSNPQNFADALSQQKVIDLADAFGSNGTIQINAFFMFPSIRSNCEFFNHNLTFRIVGEDGQIYYTANIFELLGESVNPATCVQQGSTPSDPPQYIGIGHSRTHGLPKGRYYFQAEDPQNQNVFSTISFGYQYTKVVPTGMNIGGGLRIRKISDFEGLSANPEVTEFDYHYQADKNGDGQLESYSYGRRMVAPAYTFFDYKLAMDCYPRYDEYGNPLPPECWVYQCESMKRTGESVFAVTGGVVGYDQVTVYHGENGKNGKTVYIYHNLPDLVLNYSQQTRWGAQLAMVPRKPPAVASIPSPLNGMLTEQIDYEYIGPGQFKEVRKIVNTYQNDVDVNTSTTWSIEKRIVPSGLSNICDSYLSFFYPILEKSWVYLTTSNATTFDQNDLAKSLTLNTTYYYESHTHLQLTRHEEEKSNGNKTITTFKYPADYSDTDATGVIIDMKGDRFMHTLPIETTVIDQDKINNQRVIKRSINGYAYFSSLILPKEMVVLINQEPINVQQLGSYVPVNGYDLNQYRKLYTMNYSANGNVIELHKDQDIPVAYLWGYKNSYPIAEVKNATYQDIVNGLGQANIDLLNNNPGTDAQVREKLNLLRTHPALQNKEIITLTFNPLLGITSMTDSNNITTYYEYDNMGRLKLIRDQNQNIVKQYSYNYMVR